MSDFKIDKLGFYKTRGGEKVEVISTTRNSERSVVYLKSNGDVWSVGLDGRCGHEAECDVDIISEWIEPAPRRKVTLKKYLAKRFDPYIGRGREVFWETEYLCTPPPYRYVKEIDSKEVELPEGW